MNLKMSAALCVVAVSGFAGAKAFAATPAPSGSLGGFGGPARAGGIEVNLGGGTMQQIACAPGAQLGTTCYVTR
jgi:hypothetical protein